uniref:Phosphoinositide phospholipase C n=1 Tax=Astyanax mexicanus TaxID=7994 RepID=A0A8B9JIR4_ASTMX
TKQREKNIESLNSEEKIMSCACVCAVFAGVLDDEDVRVMMQGSNIVKVRSQRWQKHRGFKLLEDCVTVWCESSKTSHKAKRRQSFCVTEVECVREGCQSECLRRLAGSVPENQCFTVVFRGGRKSLDLRCSSHEEAQCWVRGIRTLKDRVANMKSVLLSLTVLTWIRSYLRRADLNQDGKMSYDEIQHLLQMINIDLNEQYARSLFKKCDRSCDGRLDHVEIEEFCRELLRRPELDAVFRHYSSNGCVLSTMELRDFLGDQGEDASLGHAQKLILTYELNDWAQKNLFMTQNGFTMYMLSRENDIFNPDHTRVHQDMTRPLAHYYISSSHNTYLTKDQVTSDSSTEPYIRALNQGCRCVELDCWDGDKGEPMIYHGHTLTSKVLFKEVIETIAQYAFKVSPYPLILSLENHCSVEQQAVMAQHLRSILGPKLLTKPLSDQPLTQLPSPEELKGRILVKGKNFGLLGTTSSSASFSSSSDDETGGGTKSPNKKDPGKPLSSSKISPELSDLVVYCSSVSFSGFDAANQKPPSEMSSFSENEALKHIKDSGKLFVRYNSRQLSRIYPSGQRLQSSNYDPQDMWNGGCQMVALNFQTPGEQMDLNRGRFLPNGGCGYVLKPDFLCQPELNFNPENTGGGPGHIPTQLTIRVITAQQLPKINTDKPNSIVDPLVWVEIHGVAIDKARSKTQRINNNGFNPRWDCTLSFQLQVPELALVRFVVEDHDHKSKNDFVGQFTIPFTSLRIGYRHVHLLKADGSSLSPATLFIHVKVTRRGVPIKTVSGRMGKV